MKYKIGKHLFCYVDLSFIVTIIIQCKFLIDKKKKEKKKGKLEMIFFHFSVSLVSTI